MNSIHIIRTSTALLLACVIAGSSGCLKAEISLDIAKDGSGSLDAKYSISENAVNQLENIIKLSRQLDAVSGKDAGRAPNDAELMTFLNPDETRIRKLISKYTKHGITVDRLDVRSRHSQRHVDLRLKFNNIADVARADFFSDNGFSLYKRESGEYIFHRKSMNASALPANTPLMSKEAERLIAPILEGFHVTIRVHTPGRVLNSNAHRSTVSSTTWIFEQDRDPSAFQKLQNQELAILIDGKGITIPDIRIVRKQTGSGK